MSRFSKHDAKAQGWVFVHAQKEERVITSETQGESRVVPGRYVAEKTINGILVTEAAESEGQLLEQIHAYEERFQANTEAAVPDDHDEVVAFDVSGDGDEDADADEDAPERPRDATVLLPDGRVMSEDAWANRGRQDVLVLADEDADEDENPAGSKQVVLGAHQDATEAAEQVEEVQRAIEERRTRLPEYDGEQIEVEAPPLDNPGGHAGGLVVVREGESLEEAAERKAAESEIAESDRVNRANTPLGTPAPEDAPELAGVDGGIAERGDLSSESARQGATVEAAEAAQSAVEVETAEDRGEHPRQVESAAVEAKIKETRDDKGGAEADKPEAGIAAREAGAEAVQKAADERADAGKEDEPSIKEDEPTAATVTNDRDESEPEPDATEAAEKLAEEEDVDLADVEGTGKEGRVTKPDVEALIDPDQSVDTPAQHPDVPAEESPEDGA